VKLTISFLCYLGEQWCNIFVYFVSDQVIYVVTNQESFNDDKQWLKEIDR
jgi:hypothetical protein